MCREHISSSNILMHDWLLVKSTLFLYNMVDLEWNTDIKPKQWPFSQLAAAPHIDHHHIVLAMEAGYDPYIVAIETMDSAGQAWDNSDS